MATRTSQIPHIAESFSNAFHRYITRRDGSPLMDALILWRQATLDQKLAGAHTRPVSPTSDNELLSEDGLNDEDERYEASSERKTHNRAKSLPAHVMNAQAPQPSSSSWSQWWTRSKKQQQHQEGVLRPELRVSASEPVEVRICSRQPDIILLISSLRCL